MYVACYVTNNFKAVAIAALAATRKIGAGQQNFWFWRKNKIRAGAGGQKFLPPQILQSFFARIRPGFKIQRSEIFGKNFVFF